MNRIAVFALFILLALGTGFVSSALAPVTDWFQTLIKPPFNPPAWLFAPVWTALYILIGIAGARVWLMRGFAGDRTMPLLLWGGQMVLNFFWSILFFRLHLLGVALIEIVLMLAIILAFIIVTWNRERISAILFVPYAAWVSFATVLNASIWYLN